MIELFGFAVTYEVALLMLLFFIDELLPFLPTKYNGIAQALMKGAQRAMLVRGAKEPGLLKLAEALKSLEARQIALEEGKGFVERQLPESFPDLDRIEDVWSERGR